MMMTIPEKWKFQRLGFHSMFLIYFTDGTNTAGSRSGKFVVIVSV